MNSYRRGRLDVKAECTLMSRWRDGETDPLVTKNGQPVAQLGPVVSRATTLAGAHKGQIAIRGDIVAPVDAAWAAECGSLAPHADLAGPRPAGLGMTARRRGDYVARSQRQPSGS